MQVTQGECLFFCQCSVEVYVGMYASVEKCTMTSNVEIRKRLQLNGHHKAWSSDIMMENGGTAQSAGRLACMGILSSETRLRIGIFQQNRLPRHGFGTRLLTAYSVVGKGGYPEKRFPSLVPNHTRATSRPTAPHTIYYIT